MFVVALAALLLQSLAPPGYMHGSVDRGWPVVLCPEGLPNGFLGGAHGHHEHHLDAHLDPHLDHAGAGTHDPGLGEHCPLGGMLDHAAPSLPAGFDADRSVARLAPSTRYTAPRLASRARANRTRAPPLPA